MNYFFLLASVSFTWWVIIVLLHFIKTGKLQLNHFRFSTRNFIIFILPTVITVFLEAMIQNSYYAVIIFTVFGITGMIGEIIFSVLWKLQFHKRFWVYDVNGIYHSYTSILNFIPWAVGGMMYLFILKFFDLTLDHPIIDVGLQNQQPFYIPFFFVLIVSIPLSFIIAYFSTRNRKKLKFEFKELDVKSYFIFCLPILIAETFMTIFYSTNFFLLFIVFGVIAFVIEYLYGKLCEFFISKKLWHYSYYTFDNGHSTALNIIPFAVCGIYFWTISVLLSQILLK